METSVRFQYPSMKLALFLLTIFSIVVGQGPWWGGVLPDELAALNDLKSLFDSSDLIGWDNIDPCVEGTDYNTWTGVQCDNKTGTHITTITLGFASMTGALPESIGDLVKLESLILSYNQLTTLPTSIGQLGELRTLNLQENSFTGSIPTEIGNLAKLERFLISENSFSGPIPTTINGMTELKVFDASNNNLDGPIPTQFGQLLNLEKLDLEGNSLTGSIPAELVTAVKLKFIDLQGNQLTGQIPDFTQAFKDRLGGFNVAGNPLGCQYPEFLLNPGFVFDVTGIDFLCPLSASVPSGQGVTCTPTVLHDIMPREGFVNDEPTITITGTGIQPNCDIKVHFGTSEKGIATPITISETEITVKLPKDTPPNKGITVPVYLSSNGKNIAGAPTFFNVFSKCPENGEQCSGIGDCDLSLGKCSCPKGYFGEDCSLTCDRTCSGFGDCYFTDDLFEACRCYPGRGGIDCTVTFGCPEQYNCGEDGDCDRATNECVCHRGYQGSTCESGAVCFSLLPEDTLCFNGRCRMVPNSTTLAYCKCEEGWYAQNCDSDTPQNSTDFSTTINPTIDSTTVNPTIDSTTVNPTIDSTAVNPTLDSTITNPSTSPSVTTGSKTEVTEENTSISISFSFVSLFLVVHFC